MPVHPEPDRPGAVIAFEPMSDVLNSRTHVFVTEVGWGSQRSGRHWGLCVRSRTHILSCNRQAFQLKTERALILRHDTCIRVFRQRPIHPPQREAQVAQLYSR
jgi:hypothetical protein